MIREIACRQDRIDNSRGQLPVVTLPRARISRLDQLGDSAFCPLRLVRTAAPHHFGDGGGRSGGGRASGFTLIEVLVSVTIITVLMSAVFQFLRFNQQRYRGDQLLAERNQGARSALELMTQELQQAGNNPNFTSAKRITGSTDVSPTGGIVNIPVNNTQGIFYGNLVEIGSGTGSSSCAPNREVVEVKGDATHRITTTSFPAIISVCHSPNQPVFSRSLPFPNGIIYNASAPGTDQTVGVNIIAFYGDIDGNGTLSYAEYKLDGPHGTSTIQCATSSGPANCNKYRLTRFITPILNPNIPADKGASGDTAAPMADNILGYPNSAGVIRNPDGRPIIQLNYDTFGNLTYGFTTYVRSLDVDLTLQTVDRDPEVNEYRMIRMRSHIVPTNINYAWGITLIGGSPELPFKPKDPDGHTVPIAD